MILIALIWNVDGSSNLCTRHQGDSAYDFKASQESAFKYFQDSGEDVEKFGKHLSDRMITVTTLRNHHPEARADFNKVISTIVKYEGVPYLVAAVDQSAK